MCRQTFAWFALATTLLASGGALAYDCSGLPEWKRQHYYLLDDEVQYDGTAYVNTAEGSKRDRPDLGNY